MDKLNRDIRFFLFINGCKHEQIVEGNEGRKEVIYNDHKVFYSKYMNPYGDELTIFYSSREDAARCHSIVFKIREGVASLISLKRDNKDNIIDLNEQSKEVIQVAFEYAKEQRGRDFVLDDDFYMYFNEYRYCLSDLHFICTGKTWFESVLSIKPRYNHVKDYSWERANVIKNAWADVSKKLILEGVNLDIANVEGIDINEEGSAMQVFCRIRDMNNEISCKFFYKNLGVIILASGATWFSGVEWVIKTNQ